MAAGAFYSRLAIAELAGEVDWIYERFATLQAFGRPFQKRGTPWILEVNGPFFYEAKHERQSIALVRTATRVELAAYRDCDVLVCVSEPLRELLVGMARVDPEKVVVLPNGVDTEFFSPNTPPKRLFDDFTVGFVGSLVPWQSLDRLIQSLARLARERLTAKLVVVGDGIMRQEWESLSHELGLKDHVRFVGTVPREAIPGYIAGFDVGFSGQTSMRIGAMYHSPLKIYEYMAMGKPVIASAFDDARRVVDDAETGFLFNPDDPLTLDDAIRRCAESTSLETIGAQARSRVEREHDWQVRIKELIAAVESRLS